MLNILMSVIPTTECDYRPVVGDMPSIEAVCSLL